MQNIKEIKRKQLIEHGGQAQILKLSSLTPEDIIISLYIETDNLKAKELLNKYEALLVLAKIDPDRFLEKRDIMHTDIIKYIQNEGLQKEWVDLCNLVSINIDSDLLINVLLSEMMDTWVCFTWDTDNFIVGITRDKEFIYNKQYYGNYDDAYHILLFQLKKKIINEKKFYEGISALRRKGYYNIERNEQFYTIATFHSIAYINNRTKVILPNNWLPHYEYPLKFPRIWKDSDYYKELVQMRNYIMDRKGVKIYLKNSGTFNDILLMEDLTSDGRLILLYRLTTYDGYSTMGYYDIEHKYFFSAYKYVGENSSYHEGIENMVLELYAEIVCGLNKDKKRLYAIKEVEDFDNNEAIFNETNLYVSYEIYKPNTEREANGKRKSFTQKPHLRTYATRKLPEGMKASEEAVERAKEYNLVLQEGKTFVRPYKVGGVLGVRKEIKK